MSTLIDCVLLVTVHRAISISMPSSLVKMNMKLLQPSQSPSLGLFTVFFFLTLPWSRTSDLMSREFYEDA